MNKKCKIVIFILLTVLAIFLYLNRFGFTYKFWIDNVWREFPLRHLLEHFVFGFFIPIAIVYGSLPIKKYIKWQYSYFFGAFIVLVIQLQRINLIELWRSIFDIGGLIMAYFIIKD